jgi:hypothetical protein
MEDEEHRGGAGKGKKKRAGGAAGASRASSKRGKPEAPRDPSKETITLTLGDVAENHAGVSMSVFASIG